MGVAKMFKSDAMRIAQCYARENGVHETIERVSFVDAGELPDRLRSKGNFWVVAFAVPEQVDVVVEHAGVVLNIRDSGQYISVVG